MKNLLLLIDIDGTLLSTNGVAVNFMIQAAEEETGKKIKFEIIDYIGKLDPQIIETLLNKGEYSEQKIKERKNAVYNRYIQLLKPALKKEDVTIYKGVRDFLEFIKSKELKYGLLTGNTAAGAEVKLSSADLLKHFSFGAYGDDADNRAALVPIAISRAAEKFKATFPDNKVWVIGDS
ncbi:MAG: HAD hydrolase-like protein, partial [Calditrichia bacterium]|nr:HAD hydrolase-like protein [Calditrichia bacterium]